MHMSFLVIWYYWVCEEITFSYGEIVIHSLFNEFSYVTKIFWLEPRRAETNKPKQNKSP